MTGSVAFVQLLTSPRVYQEYLAKTLTEKYSTLNAQMDKVINDANSELNILNQKLNSRNMRDVCRDIQLILELDMQIDQDRLKNENRDLVAAYREKNRKHQQTQELYDRLKRKEMTAVTQTAAFDSVDEVLANVSGQPRFSNPQHNLAMPRSQAQRGFLPGQVDHNGIEQVHTHQRSGSANSGGSGGMMPPPPLPRPGGINGNAFGFGKLLSHNESTICSPYFSKSRADTVSSHPTWANSSDLQSFRRRSVSKSAQCDEQKLAEPDNRSPTAFRWPQRQQRQ